MSYMDYEEYRQELDDIVESIKAYPGGVDAYFTGKIPCPMDSIISETIDNFILNEVSLSRRIQATGNFSSIYNFFGAYAMRMAMQCVREKSGELLLKALIAVCIELKGIDDYRYSLITLSIVHRSAVKLDVDIEKVFAHAGEYGHAEGFLMDFTRRTERDKSIEAMGYMEGDSPAGVIYWPEPDKAPVNWRIPHEKKKNITS